MPFTLESKEHCSRPLPHSNNSTIEVGDLILGGIEDSGVRERSSSGMAVGGMERKVMSSIGWDTHDFENHSFPMSEIVRSGLSFDDYAPPSTQSEITLKIGEAEHQLYNARSRARLLRQTSLEAREAFGHFSRPDGGLAAELDLMFPDPVPNHDDVSQTPLMNGGFDDLNSIFGIEHSVWADLSSTVGSGSNIYNFDFELPSSNSSLFASSSPSMQSTTLSQLEPGLNSAGDFQLDTSSDGSQSNASAPSQSQTASPTGRFLCGMNGCIRSYKRSYELQRHQLSHSGVKKYRCRFSDCARGQNGFARKDHLRQHMRQVHRVST